MNRLRVFHATESILSAGERFVKNLARFCFEFHAGFLSRFAYRSFIRVRVGWKRCFSRFCRRLYALPRARLADCLTRPACLSLKKRLFPVWYPAEQGSPCRCRSDPRGQPVEAPFESAASSFEYGTATAHAASLFPRAFSQHRPASWSMDRVPYSTCRWTPCRASGKSPAPAPACD